MHYSFPIIYKKFFLKIIIFLKKEKIVEILHYYLFVFYLMISFTLTLCFSQAAYSYPYADTVNAVGDNATEDFYEISGSPFATENTPLPQYIKATDEKTILVDTMHHAYGAYNDKGKLIRWGLATAGASWCKDENKKCVTQKGIYRIYSLGDENCISQKYPLPNGGAPMPYCMYFNGGQAIHGSDEVEYANVSHGCVRVHVSDAKWLQENFVVKPNKRNDYRGTLVIIF